MFGLVAWQNAAATAGTENAINSVADPDITSQNNNFIFTGPYRLLADIAVGASVQYGRYSVAQWNGWGRPNIYSMNRAANPTSPFFWAHYRDPALMLPQNQQIQPYLTNNLGSSTEVETILWKIASQDWSMNLPAGQYDFIGHATCTVTPTAGAWNSNNTITFDQLPLGGVYVVTGAQCEGAHGLAWRLNFPRTRMYLGRRLRPGNAVLSTYGAVPALFTPNEFGGDGVWGAFHTFELPTFDILGTATSTTYDIFMKLRFLGESLSLLDQFVASNY